MRTFLLLLCLWSAAQLHAADPLFDGKTPRAFAFETIEANDNEKKGAGDGVRTLPFFRAFPAGKDKTGEDVSGTLGTLKFARGKSKLYPADDALPGLIVVLRRIVMIPTKNGDYEAILEGEYNAVRTPIAKDQIDKLQSGELTELKFASDTTKGIRPAAFRIQASTILRAAIRNGNLLAYGGSGDVTITHYGLRRTSVYVSEPIAFGPETNRVPIYLGRAVEPVVKSNGKVETLPIIN